MHDRSYKNMLYNDGKADIISQFVEVECNVEGLAL